MFTQCLPCLARDINNALFILKLHNDYILFNCERMNTVNEMQFPFQAFEILEKGQDNKK